MIEISTIFLILLIHWLADFTLQTHEQAIGKSTDIKWLSYHVGTYTLVWFIAFFCMTGDWIKAIGFASVTGLCHWVTDFITSRIGKPFWEKQDLHNGFVVVGFDQILHYVQLFICYIWLS